MKLFNIFRSTGDDTDDNFCGPTEPVESCERTGTVPVFPGASACETAYLTDESGNVYNIGCFPFVIGRKSTSEGTDLSLGSIPEISGIHAVITRSGGKYYLEDNSSTNGTFILKEDCEPFSDQCRVKKEELRDGSVFWLYRSAFTFHTDSTSSQTCIINSAAAFQTAATLPLNAENRTVDDHLECRAVITDENGETMIYDFPYESSDGGFIIKQTEKGSRPAYRIFSDGRIQTEGEDASDDGEAELFSGCHFSVNSRKYTFHIK